MSVNETCSVHFNNQHGNGLFCYFWPDVKLDETLRDLDHNFIRSKKKQQQQLKQTATNTS